ncbi:hypothetical protein GQ53DRAFT_642384 [Thozetella sp. PMI_491]|nr:hypothetical protein GQ53DRAFT_642384 [Thozetella sp. PMI_491]
MTLSDLRAMTFGALGRVTRRMQIVAAILFFSALAGWLSYPSLQEIQLPRVSLEYSYEKQASKFNESKVALLIENRPFPLLAPLMLHFISVVPPDWRFRFMGSVESVQHINTSVAIQEQVRAGKLDLTYIPSNMTTGSQEEISRFLTNLWLYETVLQPAEWLLIFQTDSILCANSRQTLNEYLDYDWVGAPWNPTGRYGGNGGLSLRKVSTIIDVLRNQERVHGSEPEDVWLTDRLGTRPGAKLANGTVSATFSGEMNSGEREKISGGKDKNSTLDAAKHGDYVEGIDDWRKGFYEPMGYHTGGSGNTLHGAIWGTPQLRRHLWDYCPEVKMTLAMDAAKFVPGSCNQNWKRFEGDTTVSDFATRSDIGYGTEVIDGIEYPRLPDHIVPW